MRTLLKASTVLTITAILAITVASNSMGSQDRQLGEAHMALLYGGANGQCCIVNTNCNMPDICSNYNFNPQGCDMVLAKYEEKAYAFLCGAPQNPCPTCNCTSQTLDNMGNKVYCMDNYICDYVIGDNCIQGMFGSHDAQGVFQCADSNCP